MVWMKVLIERLGQENIIQIKGKWVKASSRSGKGACVAVDVGSSAYNSKTCHGTTVLKMHDQNMIFMIVLWVDVTRALRLIDEGTIVIPNFDICNWVE